MKKKLCLCLVLSLLFSIFVIPGCNYCEDVVAEDGAPGRVFVRFSFPNNDVVSVDVSGFTARESEPFTVYVEEIESYTSVGDYYLVDDIDGSFSWTTTGGNTYTADLEVVPYKREKGERVDGWTYCVFGGEPNEGSDGNPRNYVIEIKNFSVEFIDLGCLKRCLPLLEGG